MILAEGLVLQEEKYWKEFFGKEIVPENHSWGLCFEERGMEGFADRHGNCYPKVKYAGKLMTHKWVRKSICFYDPDGNLIEVEIPV